jgi:hypothetical protein
VAQAQRSSRDDVPDEDEQARAQSILTQIGAGLGSIRDTVPATLAVVSCIEATWRTLEQTVLRSFLDRFEPPVRLTSVTNGAMARAIAQGRLSRGYASAHFKPAWPTWPFRAEAFESLGEHVTPRGILKLCAGHRRACLEAGKVTELSQFDKPGTPPDPPEPTNTTALDALDTRFQALRTACDVGRLREPKQEDARVAPLLQTALACLVDEANLPDSVHATVDAEFTGGATTRPLHARLRLIFTAEGEREEHYCVRAVEQLNAIAFQTRLKAAMTQAGIDRDLSFRHLTIVHSHQRPTGTKTDRLSRDFEAHRGRWLTLSDDDLRTLDALHKLRPSDEPNLPAWLASRRPVSGLAAMRTIVPSRLIFADTPATPVAVAEPTPPTPGPGPAKPVSPSRNGSGHTAPADRESPFELGRQLIMGRPSPKPVTMPLRLLEKHAVVLAGSGAGKTVLLRRIVEEAALAGIPSIVLDSARDLTTLDERWPDPPEGWHDGDAERARRYFDQTEVVVWTPGRETANPLALRPLPDLAVLADDPDELETAIAMVRESLAEVVAPKGAAGSKNKQGVLNAALRFLAHNGGGSLPELTAILTDLPPSAGIGLANERKLAAQMADTLRAEVETNPLLRSAGAAMDPGTLFGLDRPERTRISVVSLVGLPGVEAQRSFVNQLAMTLFGWIKANPNPAPLPLRGLLVIDEARDLAPAVASSVCKESLNRLMTQARKYHLGMVLATQNPKDLLHTIVANGSTHYYGKVNSPAALEALKSLLHDKGGNGDDVSRLTRGQFYVHNVEMDRPPGQTDTPPPMKVAVPMCLTHHRPSPPDDAEVFAKAVASRVRLGRS